MRRSIAGQVVLPLPLIELKDTLADKILESLFDDGSCASTRRNDVQDLADAAPFIVAKKKRSFILATMSAELTVEHSLLPACAFLERESDAA